MISDRMKQIAILIILIIIVKDSWPGSTNDIRTISTLGQQPIVLGGLYTAYHEKFIPGLSIFNSEV